MTWMASGYEIAYNRDLATDKADSNRRKPFRPAIRGFACPRQVACPAISRVNPTAKLLSLLLL